MSAAPPQVLCRASVGKRLAARDVEVVSGPLDVTPAALRAAAALLSQDERQRASRFAFDRDRNRFIAARARLRELLAVWLRVAPAAVELVYGARGKPALSRRFANAELNFNVSHSGAVAAYAFSRRREVGVDIERVRVIQDADDIVARFFSRRENESYQALHRRDKPLGFFNGWTRKEAFIKTLGEGLHHPLDSFDVTLAPGEPARILRVGRTPGHACQWELHNFAPEPGFVGAVVVEKS